MINELVERAHNNSVEHGFWEKERDFGEIIALILKIIFPKKKCNNLQVRDLTLFNYKKVYHFLLHLYYFRNFV